LIINTNSVVLQTINWMVRFVLQFWGDQKIWKYKHRLRHCLTAAVRPFSRVVKHGDIFITMWRSTVRARYILPSDGILETNIFLMKVWPCIIYISKEDVPTWCKQFYYDFILINGLYMFRTFTCPSSGVLIYRLFHCRMCVKQPIYKNSWRWICKCPKYVEAIYEKKNHSKIVCIKLVHLP